MNILSHLDHWNRELSGLYNSRELQNMWRILTNELREVPDLDINLVIQRLKNKEPFDYVLGHTEFYALPFKVDPAVLIPRPETEELVDWVLKTHDDHHMKALDIGTGSGCIAVSLAVHRPSWKITALDVSRDALVVARKNAGLNDVNIAFEKMDILNEGLHDQYDIIISNPPYIPESERDHMSEGTLGFEPGTALFTGIDDALIFYKRIGELATSHLTMKGSLFFELNEFHASAVEQLIEDLGFDVEVRRDMQGKLRMLRAIIAKRRMQI